MRESESVDREVERLASELTDPAAKLGQRFTGLQELEAEILDLALRAGVSREDMARRILDAVMDELRRLDLIEELLRRDAEPS